MTWRNLKCILLSETGQSEEATYGMIPTISHSGIGKTMETIKISVSSGKWERVEEGKKEELNKKSTEYFYYPKV